MVQVNIKILSVVQKYINRRSEQKGGCNDVSLNTLRDTNLYIMETYAGISGNL